jgi:uncharacterized Zn-binding protein involved in type VI secretion
MGQPAAKQGDKIIAVDIHIVMVPSISGQVPVPLTHPFNGIINGGTSTNVKIMGMPAATVGSTATNTPAHIPLAPGVSFQVPPTNQATIQIGSPTVKINGKPAARANDTAMTCNDPAPLPIGQIIAVGTVRIG